MLELFSPAWRKAQDAIAQRAVDLAEQKREARKVCADRKRHLKADETFVVPDYLEHSAGIEWRHCPRCDTWRVAR